MLLFLGNPSLSAWGKEKKSKLSPSLRRQVKATSAGYKKCRQEALSEAGAGKLAAKKLKIRLDGCNERFPGASLYINCKRKAIESSKGNKNELLSELSQCKALTFASTFKPEEPLPFLVEQGQLFFAGVGLNKTQPLAEVRYPGFNCEQLAEMSQTPTGAEYLLFGNHPRFFAGFSGSDEAPLKKRLAKLSGQPNSEGTYVKGLGKIYGQAHKAPANLYFAASSCSYSEELLPHYQGLSLYYLLDIKRKLATPYFAVAFYEKGFTKLSSEELSKALLAQLNESGKSPLYKKVGRGEGMSFISRQKITEFDDEGDPRNVCRTPRQHEYIAVIKSRPGKKAYPEYLLLANSKHLCGFGDKITSDFAK